jgi:nucleoside-diphosphate-sugar epimerase
MYAITGITGKVGGALARALLADGQTACAPIVERQTTLPGDADSSALFTASTTARASGKPGA